ncbi:Spermatogenesis-defective protein 39 [Aphelenchoides bicaudatus]|nr:Spermatogenesis-defective protein 39 [Aphelenchoides bicaudatus]
MENDRFKFDNAEDSYWNNAADEATFFDDTSRTAVVARQALDDLFETRINNDVMSVTNSDSDFEHCLSSIQQVSVNEAVRPSTSGENILLDQRATCQLDTKINSTPSDKPRRLGSVSVLSDCSVGSFVTEPTISNESLKTQIRQIQRDLKRSLEDRFAPLPIQDTISRLRSCRPVSLDFYKSKQQKLDLLDAAVESMRDDIVLVVILFLKQTLVGSIFREVLILRPEAAEVYVKYLKADKNYQELIDTLFSLGRIDEASMIELALALQKKQPDQKLTALRRCVHSGLSSPSLQNEATFVQEKINLLERQVLIESADKDAQGDMFLQFPKKRSLIDQSLLTTVYYCSLYHYSTQTNVYTSPQSFKQAFNLTEKEYCWMVLSALSRLQNYVEIENLLKPKKIFTSQKLVCPFPWLAFFAQIARFGGPPIEVLSRWLNSVPLDERYQVADLFGDKARDVQFETIIALKDKRKLIALMSKLTNGSANYLKAQALLSNTAQKWKE